MNRPYAEVIGDPIAHSKSPLIHNFWLQKLGTDAHYKACHVQPFELADYLINRRKDPDWLGCNVTAPHKESVAASVDYLWPGTLDIGAINTVIRRGHQLIGANTDIVGIIGPLNAQLTEIFGYEGAPEQTVAIVGAGGAARAAAAALNMHFPNWPIRLLVRRPEQAKMIASSINIPPDIRPITDSALKDVTILINASPLGMIARAPLSLSLSEMTECEKPKIIFDMVYAPLETSLLAAARQKGFVTIDGLSMLVAQAAEAFVLISGQQPPREYDNELRALLVK
jgi:shikimate dehydrogenase